MRLVYLSPEPFRQGHASYTHVYEIINNLKKFNWEISLYCPEYDEKNLPGLVSRVKAISKTLFLAMRSRKPEIYYMRWHFSAWPLSLWAKLRGVPTVVEVNGTIDDLFIAWPVTRKFNFLFRWLMESQLRWASALLPVTYGLGKVCREIVGEGKVIKIISNGANIEKFCPDAATQVNEYTKDLPDKFAIFFGSMTVWQGIRTVLSAVEDKNWPKEFCVFLVGDGVERNYVEEVAARVPERVKYLGQMPYDLLPSLVARAQMSFICTEDLEGRGANGLAPLKLFESLACGVAVIVTDMPFQSDVVRNGQCGLIVQENNPSELAKAVSNLLSSPEELEAMGKRARELAINEHSWYVRAKETHNVLGQILKQ